MSFHQHSTRSQYVHSKGREGHSFHRYARAYIIESNCTILEVKIKRCSGELFLVRFTDNSGGGIQVRRNRLFATREEAEQSLPKPSPAKKPISNPYDFWY